MIDPRTENLNRAEKSGREPGSVVPFGRTKLSGELWRLLSEGRTEDAFERLYHAMFQPILAYVSARIAERAEAEDLTQEVFLAVYRHMDAYQPAKAGAETWVYMIARRKLYNYYRDRRPMQSLDDEESPVVLAEESGVEEAVYLQEQRDFLARLLAELPETDRRIVILRYFKEKSSQETAELLGLSAGNVRVRLSRALSRLEALSQAAKE